jgi:hypothetical protein
VRAALPVDVALADQSQIGFVDECGRLECVALAVATKVAGGPPSELVIHERQKLFLRVRISSRPRLEETCHDSR